MILVSTHFYNQPLCTVAVQLTVACVECCCSGFLCENAVFVIHAKNSTVSAKQHKLYK